MAKHRLTTKKYYLDDHVVVVGRTAIIALRYDSMEKLVEFPEPRSEGFNISKEP